MARFPEAVAVPEVVYSTRNKRNRQIIDAIKLGIALRLSVIVFELCGVLLINSSSIFLDAIANLTDVVSSLFLIFCMKLAHRPPDRNHPFGHGRYEPMGGLLLGILFIVLGGVMFVQQGVGFLYPGDHRHIHPWAWVFPAIAMAVLEIAYRLLIHSAKKAKSPALASDAYHYRIDSLTSLFATFALIVAALWPEWSLIVDHAGAIVIALFMVILGLLASRDNFHQLMDRVPDSEFFDKVRSAASRTAGVEGIEKIRIQRYGPDAHVDIDVEVDPDMTVKRAHRISQKVRLEIQKEWPAVRDVTVHIEPYYPGDH